MGASGRSNYYLACRVEPELQFSVLERPRPFDCRLVLGESSSGQTKSLGLTHYYSQANASRVVAVGSKSYCGRTARSRAGEEGVG